MDEFQILKKKHFAKVIYIEGENWFVCSPPPQVWPDSFQDNGFE